MLLNIDYWHIIFHQTYNDIWERGNIILNILIDRWWTGLNWTESVGIFSKFPSHSHEAWLTQLLVIIITSCYYPKVPECEERRKVGNWVGVCNFTWFSSLLFSLYGSWIYMTWLTCVKEDWGHHHPIYPLPTWQLSNCTVVAEKEGQQL